ncbi:EamA family transporter [Patescibacteria group bacterium]|nr:EamA family transporter [Patescibacteria group bacterium]MCL5409706.1 EamA family transporter [Patescibacteria group bacterium]
MTSNHSTSNSASKILLIFLLPFKRYWPYLAIIAAHTIWGANFVVSKSTLQEFPPMSLAFLRFTLASLLLAPFIFTQKGSEKVARNDLPWLFLTGVLMVTLNIALFFLGLIKTEPVDASILTMIIPMVSVLLGWWFLKEKVYLINLIGIAAGFIGAFFIIGFPVMIADSPTTVQRMLGNVLIVLASIAWVIGAVISKKLLRKYSTLTMTATMFFVGMLTFAVPAALEYIQNPGWPTQVTHLGILGLLYITILSSVVAYFFFEWGLLKTGVIKADLFQYIEPIVATLITVLVLGQGLRSSFMIGAVLIAGGVYWSTLGKEHHIHHKAHRH